MSDVVIQVENLSKKYIIGHQKQGSYKTIRDTVSSSAKSLMHFFQSPKSKIPSDKEEFWALKEVSFEVKQGEVVGIIGRNGAGKSTLLKILSRITEPTKGVVRVNGRVASLLEVGTGFHPELTGRENIFLNGAILGMSKVEIQKKFDEIVDFAEVEKFLDTPVKHYSSGMYVRLAFAVAAHLEPEILVVDEVLAVGDATFQKKCLGKMEDAQKSGKTVLLVSHNMTSILQLCSQSIWLDGGEIVQTGDARVVVSRYLLDNRIPLGVARFDIDEGSHGVNLLCAYVTDENHEIRPDIPHSMAFCINLEYQVDVPTENLRVGFRLHNERDIAVLHTATSDCGTLETVVGSVGKQCASVQLPGNWLAPGRYYTEIGLWSPKFKHHQYSSRGLAFDITQANTDVVGEEILRPILNWSVQCSTH